MALLPRSGLFTEHGAKLRRDRALARGRPTARLRRPGRGAGVLRARYCNPRIRGINKTDGLSFKVREILDAAHTLAKEKVNLD